MTFQPKNKPIKFMKNEFGEYWKLLSKKLAYAYEYFEMIEGCNLPVSNLKKKT